MSGGVAYVFDERGDFTEKRCNLDSVDLEPLVEDPLFSGHEKSMVEDRQVEAQLVKDLVARHFALTASPRAAWILDNWAEALVRFIKVFPHEHKRVLGVTRRRQPYIPSPALAIVGQSEQVQHG
jgi:glutamate synthase domain-containing protein 3